MPKHIIPYNPKLKQLARNLRKDMTFGEVLLWNQLKDDKLWGFDFDRQRCIDNYIVDFYCRELRLAIEIDGLSHDCEEASVNDDLRQKKLESFGITFIRFSESDMKRDMDNVIRSIEAFIIDIVKLNPDVKLPRGFDKTILDG